MPIRVLIVEDSLFMQRLLAALIGEADDLKVVGVAADPIEAREKIKALAPDVLTLDVEMPRMDGITFLARLMRLRPMPVVMVSSWTETNARVTFEALELGAVDFVAKPRGEGGRDTAEFGLALVEKIRGAAGAVMKAASWSREFSPLTPCPSPLRGEGRKSLNGHAGAIFVPGLSETVMSALRPWCSLSSGTLLVVGTARGAS